MKKEICKIFKQNDLNIPIKANKKQSTSWTSPTTYELGSINPTENPTAASTIYIKIVTTRHQLWKILPKSIQIRQSNNSVNEETFEEAAGPYICLFGFLTSSSTTRLYRGRAPRQERLTILRAVTHETELGDRSHYTDTERERAGTAGIEPGTSSPGVARSTAELPRPPQDHTTLP